MRDHGHCTTGGQHSAPGASPGPSTPASGPGRRSARAGHKGNQCQQRSARPSRLQPRTAGRASRRTYVLDTSVLLADPGALKRFEEHEVVLPVVVITELEGKRHHPELGYFARSALRMLDELRVPERPPRRAGPGR